MLFTMLGFLGLDTICKAFKIKSNQYNADKYGMYLDGNGSYRLRDNKHWVIDTYNHFGEKIIKNVKNGATEINIDEIESNKRRIEAINSGKKFYLYRYERNAPYRVGNVDIKGDRYSSIHHNGVYVIRTINYKSYANDTNAKVTYYSGDFYMDMNYNICFPTEESEIRDKKIYGNNYQQIIDFIIQRANEQIKYNLNNGFNSGVGNANVIYLDGALVSGYKRASTRLSRLK